MMQTVLIALWVRCERTAARVQRRSDRGDVPGWFLITVMSAGLVVLLWATAKTKLNTMLSNALDAVTGGS